MPRTVVHLEFFGLRAGTVALQQHALGQGGLGDYFWVVAVLGFLVLVDTVELLLANLQEFVLVQRGL